MVDHDADTHKNGRFFWELGNVEIINIQPATRQQWSDGAQGETRKHLAKSLLLVSDGEIGLKNIDGAFARLTEIDPLGRALKIVNCRTGDVTTFPDIEALIAAGWVTD